MKREQLQRRTKCLTVSALLIALGVALLALGSLLETLDLSVAALASFFCIYAVIEMRGGYPWAIWVVTTGLAFLLLPQKSPALFYFLLGFYPIIKEKMERLPRFASWVVKILWVHVAGAVAILAFRFLLAPNATMETRIWMIALFYVAVIFCFVLYDIALTRLITFYLLRLKGRFGIR